MKGTNRRDVLKAVAVAAAATAALPVLTGEAEAKETSDEMAKQRYRESDQVKRFYALLRL